MKKLSPLVLVLVMAGSIWAQKDIAIGAFGGFNAPIAQQDTKSGTDFGVKAKFSPMPMIAVAAFFETRSFGDPEETVQGQDMSIDGGKVSVFGAEALIGSAGGGPGLHFYWTLGINSYKWTRDGFEDLTKIGYHLGPGLEIILPAANIGIEARGKFEIVPTDGGGSRKNAIVLIGANYHFGIL